MWLFKKKNTVPFEHLDADGNLPFGWIGRNREFTEKIHDEYNFFLDNWTRSIQSQQEHGSLKSFILYIEDCKKLCASKGECHIKWFTDCIADDKYLEKLKQDLKELEEKLQ